MSRLSAEERCLMEAIRRSPDDLRPRMVLADWYEDRGDRRGELIRVQCAIEEASDVEQRLELENAARRLVAEHWDDWIARPLGIDSPHDARFERGLCVGATLDASRLIEVESALCDQFPLVKSLTIRDATDSTIEEFNRLEFSRQIEDLRFVRPRLSRHASQQFVADASRETLNALGMEQANWTDHEFRSLSESPALTRLRELAVTGSRIGSDSIVALRESDHSQRLRVLRLDENRIGDDGAEILAGSIELSGLRLLSLKHNRIGVVGVRALASFQSLQNMKELKLDGNPLDDLGAAVIAAARGLRRLSCLTMAGCRIGDSGAESLGRAEWVKELSRIDLSRNEISERLRKRLKRHLGNRLILD